MLSGITVLFNCAEAMKRRTFSGPAGLRDISVPVLSLCWIIASSAVLSETVPIRFGGLNVALSRFHTLASSANCFVVKVCTTCTPMRRFTPCPDRCSRTSHSFKPETNRAATHAVPCRKLKFPGDEDQPTRLTTERAAL